MKDTFTPSNDKQLWQVVAVINGRDVSWPVFATPGSDRDGHCWQVEPAIPVSNIEQQNFLYSRMDEWSFHRDNVYVRWLVRHNIFITCLKKCDGITPEFYLKWPDYSTGGTVRTTPEFSVAVPEKTEGDDFVKYVCSGAGLGDVADLRLKYHLICHFALRWLVEKQKPLPLHFATLHAFPYRANWKRILYESYEKCAPAFNQPPEMRMRVLESLGFRDSMCSEDLVEMPAEGIYGWTLEVVPTLPFDVAIKNAETEMFKTAKSPELYLYRWTKIIERQCEQILDCFGDWLKRSFRPQGRVDQHLPKHLWRLAPHRRKGKVRPKALPYVSELERPIPGETPHEEAIGLQDLPEAILRIHYVKPHTKRKTDAPADSKVDGDGMV